MDAIFDTPHDGIVTQIDEAIRQAEEVLDFLKYYRPPCDMYGIAIAPPMEMYDKDYRVKPEWYEWLLVQFTKVAKAYASNHGWETVEKIDNDRYRGWRIIINGDICNTISMTVAKNTVCQRVPVVDEDGNPVMETVTKKVLTTVTTEEQQYEIKCKPLLGMVKEFEETHGN